MQKQNTKENYEILWITRKVNLSNPCHVNVSFCNFCILYHQYSVSLFITNCHVSNDVWLKPGVDCNATGFF